MGEFDAIFERLYFHELDRHDQIVGNLRLPLTVIIALLGGNLLIVRAYPVIGCIAVDALFFGLCAITFAIITLASVHLFRAASGQDYKHLSDARLLERHRDELDEWYREFSDLNDAEVDARVEAEFALALKSQFIECAENNFLKNEEKSTSRFIAHRYIRLALLPLTVAALIFVLSEKLSGEFVGEANDTAASQTGTASETDTASGAGD